MKILIATDGSDFSKKAVAKCCDMVIEPPGSKIKVISVYEAFAPMAAEPFAVSAEYYQELENAAKKQAEVFASEAANMIRERFLNADVTTEVALGMPNQMIIETAKEWGADLIVVGSHGRGFWGRVMLGSVSDSVLHHAPCSVLVVR